MPLCSQRILFCSAETVDIRLCAYLLLFEILIKYKYPTGFGTYSPQRTRVRVDFVDPYSTSLAAHTDEKIAGRKRTNTSYRMHLESISLSFSLTF